MLARSLLPNTSRRLLQLTRRSLASSLPSHEVVGLPALSPTMEAGSIAKWSVEEGEAFSAGDVIAEIQTDKATVDFEAQDDAVLAKILVPSGDSEVNVGDPICVFVEDEDDVAAFASFTPSAGSDAPAPESTPVPVTETPAPAPTPVSSITPPPVSVESDGRVVASPLAHKLAKEMGVALPQISGTGPNGRILADDVREFIPLAVDVAAPTSIATSDPAVDASIPAAAFASSDFTDYATSEGQQRLAAALAGQKQNVPHYYLTVDVNLDNIVEFRKANNNSVSVNGMLLKAAVCALKDCPVMNARWMDSFVRMYHEVALEYVLPDKSIVINNAAAKGVTEIDASIVDGDQSSEGGAGTFSVVNLGMYGVKAAAPIIKPGQSAILGLGAAENRVVPSSVEGEEYSTSVMATATLSCDHRVVDGAVGAQWLAAFKGYVENPMSMIL